MKPLNLPTCTAPATERLELFSPANGRLCGSLDGVVHACDEHATAARQAAQTNGMSAWPVYGVTDLGTCGRVVDFGAMLGETEMTEAQLDNHEIHLRRQAMPEGARVTFDLGGPQTGTVLAASPIAPAGTIPVRLDSNGATVEPHILQDDVQPVAECGHARRDWTAEQPQLATACQGCGATVVFPAGQDPRTVWCIGCRADA